MAPEVRDREQPTVVKPYEARYWLDNPDTWYNHYGQPKPISQMPRNYLGNILRLLRYNAKSMFLEYVSGYVFRRDNSRSNPRHWLDHTPLVTAIRARLDEPALTVLEEVNAEAVALRDRWRTARKAGETWPTAEPPLPYGFEKYPNEAFEDIRKLPFIVPVEWDEGFDARTRGPA